MLKVTRADIGALVTALLALASGDNFSALERGGTSGCGPASHGPLYTFTTPTPSSLFLLPQPPQLLFLLPGTPPHLQTTSFKIQLTSLLLQEAFLACRLSQVSAGPPLILSSNSLCIPVSPSPTPPTRDFLEGIVSTSVSLAQPGAWHKLGNRENESEAPVDY